ncbi:hypothetical protein ES703_107500 [subsurface metagenome]
MSPFIIILEPWPNLVKTISICRGEVFWASSQMMTASFNVRPRIKARGIISIISSSINFFIWAKSIISSRASKRGRRYGFTFACISPGRKPSFSPASTAGRARTILLICFFFSIETATATARYVFPVPAGPIQKIRSLASIASMYFSCPLVDGSITFLWE